MKPVDYTRVAKTYDSLPIRNSVARDEVLAARLEAPHAGPLRVLDVGCGTGTWLAAQARAFAGRGVTWHGADPSDAMLAHARGKLPEATLVVAPAEALPFPDDHFAFVATRFAFHHFVDKPRALDELRRVMTPGGALFLTNIAPERMPGWWVFRWFAEAAAENARYWPAERIHAALGDRGLQVTMNVRQTGGSVALSEVVAQARVRDQSHLAALDDQAYARGLAALEQALAGDPDGTTPTEVAVLEIRALRD